MTISKVATLVSTKWLRDQLGARAKETTSRNLRVLDVSFNKDKTIDTYADYQKEHIPQSLYFSLHQCIESRPEVPLQLPNHAGFTDYIQSLGVWPDTHVIAYDRFGPISSYRAWSTFRTFGHRNVSVLDGGLQKWIADGYQVTDVEPQVEKSDYVPMLDNNLLRHYEDLVANIQSSTAQVIDARPNEASVLDQETDGGIIPGSKLIPFDKLFNEDRTLKSDAELKAMFDAVGVDLNKPLISTCLMGLRACALAATVHKFAGKDVPVYFGSWMEWRHRAPNQLKQRVSIS